MLLPYHHVIPGSKGSGSTFYILSGCVGLDSNQRSSGYEPDEMTNFSTPQYLSNRTIRLSLIGIEVGFDLQYLTNSALITLGANIIHTLFFLTSYF